MQLNNQVNGQKGVSIRSIHFKAKIQLKHFSALWHFTVLFITPYDPLTSQQPPSVNKTMALSIKLCPDTCNLHSNLMQTDRQMHRHATIHTGSPRHSPSFCQVSTMYPLPIQSNPHSCEFHWLPLSGLKCTPKISHIGYHKCTPLHMWLQNIA